MVSLPQAHYIKQLWNPWRRPLQTTRPHLASVHFLHLFICKNLLLRSPRSCFLPLFLFLRSSFPITLVSVKTIISFCNDVFPERIHGLLSWSTAFFTVDTIGNFSDTISPSLWSLFIFFPLQFGVFCFSSSSRVVVGFSSREFSLGFVRRCWPKSVFCGVGIFIPQRYIKTNLILQNTSTFWLGLCAKQCEFV